MHYSMTADMINVPTYMHISLVAGWVEAPGGAVAGSWHPWHVVANGENEKAFVSACRTSGFFFVPFVSILLLIERVL